MRGKNKNIVFICQVTEDALKVIKCLADNSKREILALESEPLPAAADNKQISERIIRLFTRMGYNACPVILSLPRSQATVRYLKVPALTPGEIEDMARLQAPRYLPYPASELITGFQIISSDKEGYSRINLIVVQKETISRYLEIFKELRCPKISIILSSFGLHSFYTYKRTESGGPVMLIDTDRQQSEIAIISSGKMLFSRSFKLGRDLKESVSEEVGKTQDAYSKEASGELPRKIILVGAGKAIEEFRSALTAEANLPIEVLSYGQLSLPANLFNAISSSDYSFASLIGLGLQEQDAYLNLLPVDLKLELKKGAKQKYFLRIALSILAIVVILALGITCDLSNKRKYIGRLKEELGKLSYEAKPLENIEKRFELLGSHVLNKPTAVEILYELHRIIPASVFLTNLNYEEKKQVFLRGQTQDLDSIFIFVQELEKSAVFKGFQVKVRYATKKKTQAGEIIDFEVDCLKK